MVAFDTLHSWRSFCAIEFAITFSNPIKGEVPKVGHLQHVYGDVLRPVGLLFALDQRLQLFVYTLLGSYWKPGGGGTGIYVVCHVETPIR